MSLLVLATELTSSPHSEGLARPTEVFFFPAGCSTGLMGSICRPSVWVCLSKSLFNVLLFGFGKRKQAGTNRADARGFKESWRNLVKEEKHNASSFQFVFLSSENKLLQVGRGHFSLISVSCHLVLAL